MPSNLFNALNQYPQSGNQNMVNQIRNFARSIQGDPKQQVQQLLNSGRMSQDQFNRLAQQASQFKNLF